MRYGPMARPAAAPVLEGLRAAAEAYGVPIVGGHTNIRTDRRGNCRWRSWAGEGAADQF